ncbi:hypothetical protein BJX62DRAFT_215374 [Aspergillus germanicus]
MHCRWALSSCCRNQANVVLVQLVSDAAACGPLCRATSGEEIRRCEWLIATPRQEDRGEPSSNEPHGHRFSALIEESLKDKSE